MITAERVGSEVPADFDAVVVGVHSRALDLRLASAEGHVRLLAVQDSRLPMSPVSLALAPDDFAGALRAREFEARQGIWRTGDLHIDTREAWRYRGCAVAATREGVGALPTARAVLAKYSRTRGSATDLRALAAIASHLTTLSVAVGLDDAACAALAAHSLVGLGPGLTPSGDDALCGFLAGRRVAALCVSADRAVEKVAANAWSITTDVSAQHLALASRGLFSEALLGVAEALRTPRGHLDSAARRCAAVGASSGADALLGLMAALDTLPV